MKLQTLVISACTFLMLLMGNKIHVHAQGVFNDTMLVFNEKADFLLEGVQGNELGKVGFILDAKTKGKFRRISAPIAKRIKIPRATRVSSGPITLKHKGACYTFGCQQGTKCKGCKLHWLDRNKDGKVQPRRELRCLCEKGDQCRIRVKKSKC